VGRIGRGPGGGLVALRATGVHGVAGRMVMLAEIGVERLEAVIAGTVAGEIMQQAWPVQCMGAVATGRDWSQLMPMGIVMAVLLG